MCRQYATTAIQVEIGAGRANAVAKNVRYQLEFPKNWNVVNYELKTVADNNPGAKDEKKLIRQSMMRASSLLASHRKYQLNSGKGTVEMAGAKQKMIDRALSHSEFEYKDLMESWKQFDTKAQASIAISGFLIAAVFLYIRNTSFNPDYFERIILAGTLLFVIQSIRTAIGTLVIKEVTTPPPANEMWGRIVDVKDDDSLARVLESFSGAWDTATTELRRELKEKAESVANSQKALLSASWCLVTSGLYGLVQSYVHILLDWFS